MNTALVQEYRYDVPIENVWKALTEKDQMKIWYFPQLKEFEPRVGFKFQFDDDSAEYHKEWVVTKCEVGKTLGHSWAYKGFLGKSEVTFELSPEQNKTKLKVTQTGLDSFPSHPHFKRERFELGWENLLGKNLKNLLEKNNLSPE